MSRSEIIAQIREVMIDVLDLDELQIDEGTTAKDVEGWDSLSHLRLIVAIEEHFGVKFSTGEIERFKNVGDVVTTVEQKRGGR